MNKILIHKSYYEAISQLPIENQLSVWNAVFDLAFNGKNTELSDNSKTVFELIKVAVKHKCSIKKENKLVKIKDSMFEDFWNIYDKKVDRIRSERKWNSLTKQEHIECMNRLQVYIDMTPNKVYRKNPFTFLNNKSWGNEFVAPEKKLNKLEKIRTHYNTEYASFTEKLKSGYEIKNKPIKMDIDLVFKDFVQVILANGKIHEQILNKYQLTHLDIIEIFELCLSSEYVMHPSFYVNEQGIYKEGMIIKFFAQEAWKKYEGLKTSIKVFMDYLRKTEV